LSSDTIRIALGDDSLIVREGIGHLLAGDPEMEVVASVGDLPALREVCDQELPDVVVVDIRMPPTNTDDGIRLATELRDRHPEMGVVVLSQFSEPAYALELLDRGSDRRAYLLKDRLHDREHLIAAVREVAAGGSVVDAKVVEALIAARTAAQHPQLSDLTRRELEILALMAQGKSNQAIAENLFLSKRAVEKHINAIFMKLGLAHQEDVSRRVKAALIYLAAETD